MVGHGEAGVRLRKSFVSGKTGGPRQGGEEVGGHLARIRASGVVLISETNPLRGGLRRHTVGMYKVDVWMDR